MPPKIAPGGLRNPLACKLAPGSSPNRSRRPPRAEKNCRRAQEAPKIILDDFRPQVGIRAGSAGGGLAECARPVKAYPGGFRPGTRNDVSNTLSPQAVVGGFHRFAHSAGPGVEGSVWQASSLRTPGQANGGSSYPMRVTRVARPARCFDGGFKTRSPGAAKISLPGLQNGLLEVSAEIVAGRLCGPPSEAAREFPGGHFGSYFCNARSKHAKR